jgi:hypothetical protein
MILYLAFVLGASAKDFTSSAKDYISSHFIVPWQTDSLANGNGATHNNPHAAGDQLTSGIYPDRGDPHPNPI